MRETRAKGVREAMRILRILTKEEAKKVDAEFIYARTGAMLAVIKGGSKMRGEKQK